MMINTLPVHPTSDDQAGRPRRPRVVAALAAVVALSLLLGLAPTRAAADSAYTAFRPGAEWLDDQGKPIQGHGGQVVSATDAQGQRIYYWYGEDRSNGYAETPGVHVYSSSDLYNWTDRGVALRTMTSRADFDDPYFSALYGGYTDAQRDAVYRDLGVVSPAAGVPGAILERPKVIYNARTRQWVMWVHADGPSATSNAQYAKATAGVAVSDSPFGPFRYIDSYRLNRVAADDPTNAYPKSPGMARDMNLFVDDDGTGYIIYASEENLTLYISKLNADYTNLSADPAAAVEGTDFRRPQPWIGGQREAPALTKVDGTYYLITSGATGWAPNAAAYATATSIFGTWTARGNPATGPDAATTCNSQSTSLLNLGDGKVIYLGDRWNAAKDLYRAPSIWLPVRFGEGGAMSFACGDDPWKLDQLTPYRSWSVRTPVPAQVYLGQTSALPRTVRVTEKGAEPSYQRVAWDTTALSVVGQQTVRGTLGDGRTFTRSLTVLPRRLSYLADASTTVGPDWTAARRFLIRNGENVLNTRPDQALGPDPATGEWWGYLGTSPGVRSGSTMMTSVRWQDGGKDLSYAFGGLKPGRYQVYVGLWDPWASSAPGRAATISLNAHVVQSAFPIDATERTATGSVVVGKDRTVTVTLSPTTSHAVQVSWIIVARG